MSPGARVRPNIVVLMADQHRADVLGCAGDPAVLTPHLDALAARGTRFSRVNCQGPLCMPARASFLTERYVRDYGVYTNWAEVEPGSPTYLHALQAEGYHTTLIGKAHLSREGVTPAVHVRDLASRLEHFGFCEVHETGDKFALDVANPYTDYLRDHGWFETYRTHILDRSYQGEHESGQGATKRVPMWDATPLPLPVEAAIDAWHGREAARWIRDHDGPEPFFLFVGFPGPHDPWDAPQAAVDRYVGIDIPAPRVDARPDPAGAGTYGLLLRAFLDLSDSDTMTEERALAARRSYDAGVSLIDDGVGAIVDALDATGRRDSTWLIYTSDHGEMGGDHGLMSKCVFYEAAVRIPLVICAPDGGGAGTVVAGLVEQIDIPATIRAIAGAPSLPGSDGRSLLDAVSGADVPARDLSVSENWGFAAFETETHKLVVDEDHLTPCQLFDLDADPAEDHNIVADPASAPVVDAFMARDVAPFFATAPKRPHRSPFTGRRSPSA